MSDRSQLDLTQKFQRGNKELIYWFNEASTLEKTRSDILKAFKGGTNCFQFKLKFKGREFGAGGDDNDFVAIPHSAGFDELDALEVADRAFARFTNTIAKLL